MKTPRGLERKIRRERAKVKLSGKGFHIYWNGGNPNKASLAEALAYRNGGTPRPDSQSRKK